MQDRLLLTALATLSVMIGGCAVYPEHGPSHRHDEIVTLAPPPNIYEDVGHPPFPGHIWISGYWHWTTIRYIWVPGRWETPRHGHSWVPHRWEHDGKHWRHHGGTWERDTRAKQAPTPSHGHPLPHQDRFRAPATLPVAPHQPERIQRPAPTGAPADGHHGRPHKNGGDTQPAHRGSTPDVVRTVPPRVDPPPGTADRRQRPGMHVVHPDGRGSRHPPAASDRQRAEEAKAADAPRSVQDRRGEAQPRSEAARRGENRSENRSTWRSRGREADRDP